MVPEQPDEYENRQLSPEAISKINSTRVELSPELESLFNRVVSTAETRIVHSYTELTGNRFEPISLAKPYIEAMVATYTVPVDDNGITERITDTVSAFRQLTSPRSENAVGLRDDLLLDESYSLLSFLARDSLDRLRKTVKVIAATDSADLNYNTSKFNSPDDVLSYLSSAARIEYKHEDREFSTELARYVVLNQAAKRVLGFKFALTEQHVVLKPAIVNDSMYEYMGISRDLPPMPEHPRSVFVGFISGIMETRVSNGPYGRSLSDMSPKDALAIVYRQMANESANVRSNITAAVPLDAASNSRDIERFEHAMKVLQHIDDPDKLVEFSPETIKDSNDYLQHLVDADTSELVRLVNFVANVFPISETFISEGPHKDTVLDAKSITSYLKLMGREDLGDRFNELLLLGEMHLLAQRKLKSLTKPLM